MISKNYIASIIFILFFTSTLLSQNCSIKIKVSGIDEVTGHLSIGLFDDPNGFPKKNSNNIGVTLEVTDVTMEHTFTKLKKGVYAIAIYHDENSNGELDRNFLGMPSEDYVFSNYATGNLGPPSFGDSKFELIDSLTITLDLQGE